MNAIIPLPQIDVSVRDATLADVSFIDHLQKLHCKQVGFMRTSWIEVKIAKGEVIIAVDPAGMPLGYCMGVDRYFKRDDVGIIHQMNVTPGRQRSFIGATLLKAIFERSAYGCRLFCCWCAQDLSANHFWEAMGFVPLAYRAGSEKKSRVHIFWQKRIREGDDQTPWWFPAKTDGGAMRADRIVLPILPGVHWSDEMPLIIRPSDEQADVKRQLPAKAKKARLAMDPPKKHGSRQYGAPPSKPVPVVVAEPLVDKLAVEKSVVEKLVVEKPKRQKQPKPKADPKLIAAARELRDRWLEHANANPKMLVDNGKYQVTRAIAQDSPNLPALPAIAA